MEYTEGSYYNTFENKYQIHYHLQSVKMLCAFKKSKFSECHEIGQAN